MNAISARSPATFGLWPEKEFKLANFWDANTTKELALKSQTSKLAISKFVQSHFEKPRFSGLLRCCGAALWRAGS
jgi:hypothetical protein